MRNLLSRLFGGYKGLFFIFIVGVGLTLHLYTQQIINQLRDETRSIVQFYAQTVAQVTETESSDDISFIFDQIILKINFPLINTDVNKVPTSWKGINIDPNDASEETIHKVQRIVNQLDKEIDPVPIRWRDIVLGYLYYGDSHLIKQLQWLPYIEAGIMGLFIFAGFIGYASIKRSEQRYIWVGMAKETAHQLGTPISSLMGWLEVMESGKSRIQKQIAVEIEKDLQRLSQVSKRFSQIGSKPDLKKTDIKPVLIEVIEYIKRRIPHIGHQMRILEYLEPVPPVALNIDLFQWAIENIMKNGLDAIDKKKGLIEVKLGPIVDNKKIFIEIKDNGKGIGGSNKKKIFKPGYSTKKRGWGLGLNLAKRIIEEYHRGKLYLKETKVGEGTIMRIELKC
ncbi:HAMP domain-containing histidine kinase [bacterium]|nr:HAMP domain-containing histidine kinase [bacterium]RQV93753.1 MAG: sensor histidine kinase [bacterium]